VHNARLNSGSPRSISSDRHAIVVATSDDAVDLHEDSDVAQQKQPEQHVLGLCEEWQANREGEYDVSEIINTCGVREWSTFLCDCIDVAIRSRP
jgi:hypothetical protein